MQRLLLLLLFIYPLSVVHAQKLLKGLVLDADKNSPVPKASVFLSNTSIGTTANDEGRFELYIPAGKFEFIVSSVGYATHRQSLNTNEAADFITVELKPKAPELEAVIIEPYEKDGWEKWGTWFIESFIGTTEYSSDCRIRNSEVLKFRNSKKYNELTVTATAPLQIENKALGYRITYQLEDFRYNFKTRLLFYAGYPFFENMQGNDRKQRQWEKAREDAYTGSVLHFMRALYRNKISEEGFAVRRLQKIPNAQKQRVQLLYKTSIRADENGRLVSTISRDSAAFYRRIMSEDDYKNVYGKSLLTGDSIAYAIDSTVAGFDFSDYLLVLYKNKKVPVEFRRRFPESGNDMMSEITLLNGRPLQVLANGSYYSPDDLLNTGYWAWWEKMGTMLPFDYVPPRK